MFCSNCSSALNNILFQANHAASSGGGLTIALGQLTLQNAAFINNSARSGGGVYTASSTNEFTNVTFNGNSASNDGGGFVNYSGTITINYATFSGNTALPGLAYAIENQQSGAITVNSSIVWVGTAGQTGIYNSSNSTLMVTHSDVKGGCPSGASCSFTIDIDPVLGPLNLYGGSIPVLPISWGSPARDAIAHAACLAGISTDQRGKPRPYPTYGACDMGAFEWQNDGHLTFMPLLRR